MIDTSTWKKFKIKDLFDVVLARGDIKFENVDKGNIPLVSAINNNNGIIGYISEKGDGISEIFTGNKITINKFGKSYYQENDFYARSHGDVNILIPKFNLTKMIAIFICTIIDKHQNEFSFSNACFSNKAKEMIIILPVTSEGTPDWKYMESFMQDIASRCEITIESENTNTAIDTSTWKKFKISDIFDRIVQCKPHDFGHMEKGSTAFIGRTGKNNGIQGYVKVPESDINPGKCITISRVATNIALWQDEPFTTSQHITAIYKNGLNKMQGLFIVTIINKTIEGKFNYSRTMHTNDVDNMELSLPATSEGTPDWQYMEDYMKSISRKCIVKINGKEI